MKLNWSQHKDGNWFASGWYIQFDTLGMNNIRKWSLRRGDWDSEMMGDYEDDPEVLKSLAQHIDDDMNGEDALTRIQAEIRRLQDAQTGEPYDEVVRLGKMIDHFDFVAEWLKGAS